jgi:Periplasmic copper-binding protein (NosD)
VTDGGSFGVRVLFTTSAKFLHGTLTNTRLSTIDAPGTVLDRVKADSSPIDFDESDTSRLTHSVLRESPVELFEDNKVLVADNTLDRSPIVVSGNSVAETFRHNTITNADVGINYFDDVRHSQFVDNTFRSNGIGLRIRTQGLLFLDGVAVSANRFVGNRAAGALIDARDVLGLPVTAAVRGNRFTGNGHAPGGLTDHLGNPVADGLHIAVPAGGTLLIGSNRTVANGSYGIFAVPGTVVDAGGNTSAGNPLGCLGVACT